MMDPNVSWSKASPWCFFFLVILDFLYFLVIFVLFWDGFSLCWTGLLPQSLIAETIDIAPHTDQRSVCVCVCYWELKPGPRACWPSVLPLFYMSSSLRILESPYRQDSLIFSPLQSLSTCLYRFCQIINSDLFLFSWRYPQGAPSNTLVSRTYQVQIHRYSGNLVILDLHRPWLLKLRGELLHHHQHAADVPVIL